MIYVARIDDAFAGFNFNGQYFHGIRDPLFLSLSVTSIKHPARKISYFQLRRSIHHPVDDLSPPPRFSSKAFGPIIRSLVARNLKEELGEFRERHESKINRLGVCRKKGPEFTSILRRMDISLGGRPSSGNGARLNFQIIGA